MNFLRALKRAIFGKSSPNEHLDINVKSENIYNSNRDCEDLLNQKIPENGSYFDIYGLIGDQCEEHDQSNFEQSKHEFEKQTFQSWPPKNKIGKYDQSRPNEYVHIGPEGPKDDGTTKALDTTLRELLQEVRQDLQDQPYFDGKIKMPDAGIQISTPHSFNSWWAFSVVQYLIIYFTHARYTALRIQCYDQFLWLNYKWG